MATSYTEGLYISDIVKAEADMMRSRESMLVDASQTLVRGQVVQKGVGDRIKAIGTLVNEVQLGAITGTLTAGSWHMRVPLADGGFEITPVLAYNSNTAAIQTALNALTGEASAIVAGGTAITAMTFTFSGISYAGKTWPLIEIIPQDDLVVPTSIKVTQTTAGGHATAETDEVQTLTVTGTGVSGDTFTLSFPHYNGTTLTTADIVYGANAATIETAIEVATAAASPAIAADAIKVGGTDPETGDLTLTYSGEHYEGRDWPLATMDITLATGWTDATWAETTKGSAGGVGSGDAVGIVLNAVTTAAGVLTTKETVLVRDAVVDVDQVTFGANANKVDVIAQLKAVGIIMRSEPATTSA